MGRVGVAALLVCLVACVDEPQRPPNVLLIISDDVGWPYHGFLPNAHVLETSDGPRAAHELVETPNLDRLAAHGVTFTRGYNTGSTCVRSLQTYLSALGLHSSDWGRRGIDIASRPALERVSRRSKSRYVRTLPRELARHGYVSWEGGKMWEGTFEDAGFTRGMATEVADFGVSVGQSLGRDGWDAATCGSTAPAGSRCEALTPLRTFLDEFPETPWFVWFAPMIPHVPLDPPAAYARRYEELGVPGAHYLANVRWLDEVVGELLSEVERRGLRDRTLVIYASDNGWGRHRIFQRSKGTPYDLGHRTPIVFNWPGRIPAGVVYDELVSTADIPATILDYAGVPPIPGSRGTSLRSWIDGRAAPPHEFLASQSYGPPLPGRILVTDEWKYIRFRGGREELYRIATDPFEERDLARGKPAVRTRLGRLAKTQMQAMADDEGEVEVVGRLVDGRTGAPVEGIELRLAGGSGDESLVRRATTDPGGWFRFDPVPPGDGYSLESGDPTVGPLHWSTTRRPIDPRGPIVTRGFFHPLMTAPVEQDVGAVMERSR